MSYEVSKIANALLRLAYNNEEDDLMLEDTAVGIRRIRIRKQATHATGTWDSPNWKTMEW